MPLGLKSGQGRLKRFYSDSSIQNNQVIPIPWSSEASHNVLAKLMDKSRAQWFPTTIPIFTLWFSEH